MGHESTAGRSRTTLVTELQNWAAQWGDLASVVGLLVSLIGFAITIAGVRRAKGAAEQARQAAIATRESIAHYDAIADLSAAMTMMDEIKRLQRHAVWAALPDRYSDLRRRLITIRNSRAHLSEVQRESLQLAIEEFAEFERTADRAAMTGRSPRDLLKLNETVSVRIDEVHALLLSLQRSSRVSP
jgi:hypothetical protein